MKSCTRCNETKELTNFRKHKGRPDGLQSVCTPCLAIGRKKSYEKHKTYVREKAKETKARVRAENKERLDVLKSQPCLDCKNKFHPCQMQFDHLGEKEYNVSEMIQGFRWETIQAEIAKCELVCANCHSLRTYNRRTQTAL